MNDNRLRTPCFLLDADELRANFRDFAGALAAHFSETTVAYSVKTNSHPEILRILREEGAAAEVVSDTEYRLARALGFESIIYNGPVKEKDSFLEAIQGGAVVNLDSRRELDWLAELPSDGCFKVGLRVNVTLPEDETFSRFGFDGAELAEAVTRVQALPNVRLAGIHLHRTSKSRSLEVYRHIAAKAIQVLQEFGLKPEYIDIGGGFFGHFPGKPGYAEYAAVLAEGLRECGARIIIEPGNALIASPLTFFASVIDVKTVRNERVVVCDGSRGDIDPFFRKTDYFKEFPTVEEGRQTAPVQTVVGCTCLENDRLFRLEDGPELHVGDHIVFRNTGAYTMALSPLFIRYFPRVYVRENATVRPATAEWTAQDYLNGYGI
ncbi:MAG: alanine racemase [Bacteroidales bacterium]|nr:alanine racemase [Bacteroidales bacterium]